MRNTIDNPKYNPNTGCFGKVHCHICKVEIRKDVVYGPLTIGSNLIAEFHQKCLDKRTNTK